jgi:hydroxymethylpyrimidine/phosphomethylpyrimidine kinase
LKLPVALTIAGSDSGGGAGIQADLKTFAALGVHGTSAVTAITAQNTVTVTDILELPTTLIAAQIDAVVSDLHPAAAKTGMLSSAEIIGCVAQKIAEHGITNLVVDPVMVAKGGAKLLRDDAVEALRTKLLPLAAVITPNLPEAEVLLGRTLEGLEARKQAARDLQALGPKAVVVKGGHVPSGHAEDVFFDGAQLFVLSRERVPTRDTHGSGCVFSAAMTAYLAKGLDSLGAFGQAKDFITAAIVNTLDIGSGHGPVNPMWQLR